MNPSTQLEVSGSGAEQFLESVMVADLKNLHINTGKSVHVHMVMACTMYV